ncbi:hypothetical protein GQ53DRAFT_772243 [Thozetella sp. PMI_491]|nr:hypothetical protein GQ53DRAFT_772243 [Thozetella sp. PMI_491]
MLRGAPAEAPGALLLPSLLLLGFKFSSRRLRRLAIGAIQDRRVAPPQSPDGPEHDAFQHSRGLVPRSRRVWWQAAGPPPAPKPALMATNFALREPVAQRGPAARSPA